MTVFTTQRKSDREGNFHSYSSTRLNNSWSSHRIPTVAVANFQHSKYPQVKRNLIKTEGVKFWFATEEHKILSEQEKFI